MGGSGKFYRNTTKLPWPTPPSAIDNKQSQREIFIWRCRCWRWNSQLCLSFRTVAGPWLLERHWWWSHHDNAGEFSGTNRLVPSGENRFVIFKVVCPKWQVSTGRCLWWCNERTTKFPNIKQTGDDTTENYFVNWFNTKFSELSSYELYGRH